MKRLIYLSVFITVLVSSSPYRNEVDKNNEKVIIDEFEMLLEEKLPDDRSISGAIVKGDKIIWSKAFGDSNWETHSSADTSTIYRTGSISKSFTAFLMMLLVQDGIIELDNPVEQFLPEVTRLDGYTDSTKITFRQLATHTSGLMGEPK